MSERVLRIIRSHPRSVLISGKAVSVQKRAIFPQMPFPAHNRVERFRLCTDNSEEVPFNLGSTPFDFNEGQEVWVLAERTYYGAFKPLLIAVPQEWRIMFMRNSTPRDYVLPILLYAPFLILIIYAAVFSEALLYPALVLFFVVAGMLVAVDFKIHPSIVAVRPEIWQEISAYLTDLSLGQSTGEL